MCRPNYRPISYLASVDFNHVVLGLVVPFTLPGSAVLAILFSSIRSTCLSKILEERCLMHIFRRPVCIGQISQSMLLAYIISTIQH